MNKLIVLCCIVSAVIAQEKYTDKYDHINIEEILGNKRLLTAYFECIMDRGQCTAPGAELKAHLQDAIETGCAKCTDIQNKNAARIFKHLIENERAMWDEATAKYDPTGKWLKAYADRAKQEGITLP